MRANGVSELENFVFFQSAKSHFPHAYGLMAFIELMRANGVRELEKFGIFQFKKSHSQHARGLMTFY